ncbi:di-trans,poly-cis-decaprenylcistransferase [Candidatus Fermentibacteria bacterium]|jgi:undecaprenyl diphosphate synthase|nr:MAG: di-trans,poly-cis-decaprenylcistransferase [Candidatus Fermentibacteria bacterium]
MDGNGRWARKRGLARIKGHTAAEKSIHDAVEVCGEEGIKYLTLYAFSTENWSRPRAEVNFIMKLLSRFIKGNIDELHRKNVRLRTSGRLYDIPDGPRSDLERAIQRTSANTGLNLVLALSYGGRAEIRDAVAIIAEKAASGDLLPSDISEETISNSLYNPDIPDPDVIIRTSGEQRLSNFLLWQSAYSEFVFTPVLWPDFHAEELRDSLSEFRARKRRFGGLE